MSEGDLAADLATHDAALASEPPAIWVGSEPTFTDASSLAPEWVGAALGGDKEARAKKLVAALASRWPSALVVRSVGRQYPGEARPRFSFGLYGLRSGEALRGRALDPMLGARVEGNLDAYATRARDAFGERLASAGFACVRVDVGGPLSCRLAVARSAEALAAHADPWIARPSVHEGALPETGLRDELAERGVWLFAFGPHELEGERALRVELPAIASVDDFVLIAGALAASAGALVLTGHPPPVDARVSFTTVTPDPGVVEVNAAPCPDASSFLAQQRDLYEAAREVGLSPERFRYDGTFVDSGGGGHLTLGGPSPDASPFVRAPSLLPGLVRYVSRHPSLTYLFAVDSIGSSSQSPRADETVMELAAELPLALHRLDREPASGARMLWEALAPLLADHAGNTHRTAINVEKLGNPHLPGRGMLGVVELRAMRMPRSPEEGAARAALFRAVAARLSRAPYREPLARWGDDLHDRFALPFHLERDLLEVLEDLAAHGLALGDEVRARLLDDTTRRVAALSHGGLTITLRRAIEFWPLVGDTASQERSGARWVDASTQRLEIVVRGAAGVSAEVRASGARVPLERVSSERFGDALVGALRYRAFEPRPGLHPGLAVTDPVELVVVKAGDADALRAYVYAWIPGGGVYEGLPQGDAEAQRRIAERVVTEVVPVAELGEPARVPEGACTERTLDLRWL